jgi:hypothetical protein
MDQLAVAVWICWPDQGMQIGAGSVEWLTVTALVLKASSAIGA